MRGYWDDIMQNRHFLLSRVMRSAALWWFAILPAVAEVVTDGTMGAVQQLSGPRFTIDQSLGRLSGQNLFHSFERFNLQNGESAHFTGQPSIQNVISRVTGGSASIIDGSIQSDIGSQGFYFINPAGILMGKNARVDVPAAFHLSTADKLVFSDQQVFYSHADQPSQLSVASPQRFGFIQPQQVQIAINGSELSLNPNQAISISAANISIDQASLSSHSGQIKIQAVGSATTEVDPGQYRGRESANGNLLVNNSSLTVSGISDGSGSGGIALVAGDIRLSGNSHLKLNNESPQTGSSRIAGLYMDANQIDLRQTQITARTLAAGNNHDLRILASDTLQISQSSIDTTNSYDSTGQSGRIILTARNINIKDKTTIESTTYSDSPGGDIFIAADIMEMDGYTEEPHYQSAALIRSETSFYADDNTGSIIESQGDAGNIQLDVGLLKMSNSAQISSKTRSNGRAGQIIVNAQDIEIDGHGYYGNVSDPDSGEKLLLATHLDVSNSLFEKSIRVDDTDRPVYLPDGTPLLNPATGEPVYYKKDVDLVQSGRGNAGEIRINSQSLLLANGGQIASNTNGDGNAGNIVINARNIQIVNDDTILPKIFTGVLSNSNAMATGNSGDIQIKAGNIELSSPATVIGNKVLSAQGKGGVLRIEADSLFLDRETAISGYTAGAGYSSNIQLQLGKLMMQGKSAIVNLTLGAGDAGVLAIAADEIHMDQSTINSDTFAAGNAGTIFIKSSVMNMQNRASVSSQSTGSGDAASIRIESEALLQLDDLAHITTDAISANAGDIELGGNKLILQDGLITTSVGRFQQAGDTFGDGGSIIIDNKKLYMLEGFIQANTQGLEGKGGDIIINADPLIASYKLEVGGGAPRTFVKDSGLNIIQAAAPAGAPGNIDIRSPIRDLSAELADIENHFAGLEEISKNPCQLKQQQKSSLIIQDKPAKIFNMDEIFLSLQPENVDTAPVNSQIYPDQPLISIKWSGGCHRENMALSQMGTENF